jgi:hypothetical protein
MILGLLLVIFITLVLVTPQQCNNNCGRLFLPSLVSGLLYFVGPCMSSTMFVTFSVSVVLEFVWRTNLMKPGGETQDVCTTSNF